MGINQGQKAPEQKGRQAVKRVLAKGLYVLGTVFLVFVNCVLGEVVQEDEILSPYFAVESADAELESFPLKSTSVKASVAGVFAHVTVTQTYANNGKTPINAKYIFPASTRAAVHGMKMTIGEHVITARIEERRRAKQEFEAAKKEGKSASLLQQQRPNVFSMDVANVMPGDVIVVELRYSELLASENGVYEFVYPTVVGPRYSEITKETATEHDQWVQNPYLHEGEDSPSVFDISVEMSTGVPLSELVCATHETDILWDGTNAAVVSLRGDAGEAGNRDFILRYSLMGKQVESGLLLYEGKEENFFLLLAQPPERVKLESIPPREYIFVVDVSGSMSGFPLTVSKQLLRSLISGLRPTDTFNVILFSGTSASMSEVSIPANAENINRAIAVIDDQKGSGGTRLTPALEHAFSMPHGDGVSRSIVIATDGFIEAEKDAFAAIRKNLNEANVFAFGIGSSVNRFLIEGLAKAGQGEPFVVTRQEEAADMADKMRRYIESPVLTDIKVDYAGFEVYDVEPESIPDIMANRPVQVFGKWRGLPDGAVTITGSAGDGAFEKVFNVADVQPKDEHSSLRYLWARARIAELSDYNCRHDDEDIKEITSLGLTYELLTRYTSFIAIHDVVRNVEKAGTDVTQPLPLPQGVTDLAVGGEQKGKYAPQVNVQMGAKVPEPELIIMMLIIAAGCAVSFVFSRLRGVRGN